MTPSSSARSRGRRRKPWYAAVVVCGLARQIMGRCHVGESFSRALRHFADATQGGYAAWRGRPREERREAIRQVCAAHARNRDEYAQVMLRRERW